MPDIARGWALCLISIANIMLYLHGREYGLRQRILPDSAADQFVTFFTVALVDARVYPLFALLLGYGVARQVATRSPGVVRWRGIGLILFGAVHGLLLFAGDVLALYGVLTLILLGIRRASDRGLIVAAALLILPTAMIQGLALAEVGPTLQRSILWSIGIADPWEALAWRPLEWVMGFAGMSGVVPAALLGLWAGRRNLLAARDISTPRCWVLGIAGVAVGFVGGTPAAAVAANLDSTTTWPGGVIISVIHVATGIFAGIGYALLTLALCRSQRFITSRVANVLSAVGQRSLTCYLLQSIIMVPLFPAWTIALGAQLDTVSAFSAAILAYVITALVAVVLQMNGNIKPAEQLLRHFAYRAPTAGEKSRKSEGSQT